GIHACPEAFLASHQPAQSNVSNTLVKRNNQGYVGQTMRQRLTIILLLNHLDQLTSSDGQLIFLLALEVVQYLGHDLGFSRGGSGRWRGWLPSGRRSSAMGWN